jgi:hypothetical protein
MNDRHSAPRVGTHVNPNRAIIGTDAALHATRGVWHHVSGGENFMLIYVIFEKSEEAHIEKVACT